MTDSNGTLVSTYQYDPYGNLLSSTGSVANPWRFAGGYFDSSTGLYKFGTRYYKPGFGRWSQQDPIRGKLDNPTSLNRYVYAVDDPVNLVDPSGRDAITQCLIAAGAAFIIALIVFVLPLITGGLAIGFIAFMLSLYFGGLIGELWTIIGLACLGAFLTTILTEVAQALGLTP